MIPTVAVIPTRYEPARLRRLLAVLDADKIIGLDNGHARPLPGAIDARGLGLYAMWNLGTRLAREYASPVNVAILNDDIHVLPGTLRLMARALRSDEWIGCVYPDARTPLSAGLPPTVSTTTLFSAIGPCEMTGYCFMFKGELALPAFDESYEWWYGDTGFDEGVRVAGYGVARVDGLPIEHESDAELNGWARRPELQAASERDIARWARAHDHIEEGRWLPAREVVAA